MRETFTSGTVGGELGNRCFYPEKSTPSHSRWAGDNVLVVWPYSICLMAHKREHF